MYSVPGTQNCVIIVDSMEAQNAIANLLEANFGTCREKNILLQTLPLTMSSPCLPAVIFGCEGDACWSGGASHCLQLTEGPGGGVVEGHPGSWVAVVLNGQQWNTQPHHVQNEWVRA